MIVDPYATAMKQRTDVSKEASLGSREDDAVHPSLVFVLTDHDRREEAPLAGSGPPSGHQSARDQGRPTFVVRGYMSKDLQQDFWKEGRERVRIWWIGSLGQPFIRCTVERNRRRLTSAHHRSFGWTRVTAARIFTTSPRIGSCSRHTRSTPVSLARGVRHSGAPQRLSGGANARNSTPRAPSGSGPW